MLPIVAILLTFAFLLSIVGLFFLIWSLSTGQFSMGPDAPRVIFDANEIGVPEDPASTVQQIKEFTKQLNSRENYPSASGAEISADSFEFRSKLDEVARKPVLLLVLSSVFWLLLGSIFGLMVSYKMHSPDFLSDFRILTFGRIRPLHLNTVAYGWVSMAGMGVSLWLTTRILKTSLIGSRWASYGCVLWNFAMSLGTAALLFGYTDGAEWLEYPWYIDIIFVIAGACIGVPVFQTIKNRNVHHLYVSIWYIGAAFIWFPFLFLVANWPNIHFGVQHAIVNWWFAHNVLGLWLTPFGLAAVYYFIPKILGKPIHSYQLSLLGFWALALFYSQVGLHHLIGGPVPTWLVTISIVTSVMMMVPVTAVGINHHMTMIGHFKAMKFSPTLAFIVSGALMYTLTSIQGSLHSLRSFNNLMHFTHGTVAHAHLGVYGFVSFVMFGSLYFILPRIVRWEWPYPRLITLHYWLALSGILVYFVFLSIGGFLQALKLLDSTAPFMESVTVTLPYLAARTFGGILMSIGHFVFAFHIFALLRKQGSGSANPSFNYRPRALLAGGGHE